MANLKREQSKKSFPVTWENNSNDFGDIKRTQTIILKTVGCFWAKK